MTEADVQVTAYVRKAALEGLGREQGRTPQPWQPFLGAHFGHLVRQDPGGSWVAEASLLRDGRWDEVTRLAREASKLER